LKTFVDNVCKQVVERHKIRNMPKVFQPESIIILGNEDLRRIATEPSSNVEKRQESKHRLNHLRNL
jgi:hypothetical protein